ncbi:hypothetical protein [Romboutsia lituseburensis]|uniref:hypothetical protein n=1 Tax=Romboutsia lituseburensis TaxID=1537 RepID=UPI00215B3438|nr:hypothetical protein [Romboutsia lituseburensis]MCR8745859.1 hypothetical protein [Romboutsia lituseburensis]
MSNYKILSEKIKQAFEGFCFYEEIDYCIDIDIELTDQNKLKNRHFGIDSFPSKMKLNSPYKILDVFWDLEKNKKNYLMQEDKFLRALLLTMNCSNDIVISCGSSYEDHKKYFKQVLKRDELKMLDKIKHNVFDLNSIDIDYKVIGALVKLALRERNNLAVYMLDLEIAFYIDGLYSDVYLGENGNLDIVEYICNVEGLYIRDRYIEE